MPDASNSLTLPMRLAVVICTRDRPTSLLATLASIWTQSRLPDELLIVDDGRLAQEVIERIAEQCRSNNISFQCRSNPSPGLTRGRNFAADIAESDVLLYLDDDVTCDQEFIARIAEMFADPTVAGVTADVAEPAFESLSSRLYQLGYRLAGWWQVTPRGAPPGPRPAILSNPHIAAKARWLSGAAMAIRRDVVRKYRFDENLTRYALGEDREMGYRLAPHHWLLEARHAHVVHRRATSQRTDSRRLGFMTSFNYLYILQKTCRPGVGGWLLIGWSLLGLAAMHLVWSIVGDRQAHLLELWGMMEGVASWLDLTARKELGSIDSPDAPKRGRNSISQFRITHRKQPLAPNRRVLFVTNRLEPGGAELMLLGLVKHLPVRGIDPSILCLKDAGPLAPRCREMGIPVYEGMLHHKADAIVIQRIARIIAENKIDIVVVAHSGGDRMFWSTLAAAVSRTPLVVWSHWFPRAGMHHFERANRALYRFVDVYVALGERHRDAMMRYEHVPAGRITVIPNSLDMAEFMTTTTRAEARQRLRLDDDQIGIGIVANLRPEKRHDVFIEAARRLSASDSRLRFFIIGDGPYRDTVQRAAAASGLDHETLRWMGAREDVPVLLSGLDVACLCSDVECFSVTMLEAAAAGCPFIGPNSGCLPEFLEHGRTGLLIKPGSADDLTDAIRGLASSASLRESLTNAARTKVVRDYSLERTAQAFSDLFYSLSPKARQRVKKVKRRARQLVAAFSS